MRRPLCLAVICLLPVACGDKTTELIRDTRRDASPSNEAGREAAPRPSCTGNQDCPLALPRCDLATAACEPCTDDANCPSESPRCHPVSGACVQCLENDDCRNRACTTEECFEADLCETARSRCVECTTDGHCDGSETCSTALGLCATACTRPGDCPFDEPICDAAIRFCVECRDDRDCPSGRTCRASECRLRSTLAD